MTARAYRLGADQAVAVQGRTPAEVLRAAESRGAVRVRWPWGAVWLRFSAGWLELPRGGASC